MRRGEGHREILRIALPAIVSNITVPLLGLVDVAIVGHLGAPAYIGAIAVGGMLFNIFYWVFAFLRMGTSGLTSQAYGRHDLDEVTRLLVRALGVGAMVALLLIALQYPLCRTAFLFIEATPEVERLASLYFRICIWGAPAVLGLYAFSGWFIGMQNARFPMWIAITQNVVNIVASLLLVYVAGLKVEGVALGTLIAQYAGLFMAIILWRRFYKPLRRRLDWRVSLRNRAAMVAFFKVNRDIFFRTLCLVAVTLYFTSAGAAQGEVVLAVNTLLMQLFTLFSYVMDGFAYAGEALAGKYIGARNEKLLHRTVRQIFAWGGSLALLFILFYGLGGEAFLSLLTDDRSVIEAAGGYFYWALLIPVVGFAAFMWDGIYIGATATRGMLLSMFVASLLFFIIYLSGRADYGNHALWAAFIVYLFSRGAVQTFLAPKVLRMNRAGRA